MCGESVCKGCTCDRVCLLEGHPVLGGLQGHRQHTVDDTARHRGAELARREKGGGGERWREVQEEEEIRRYCVDMVWRWN